MMVDYALLIWNDDVFGILIQHYLVIFPVAVATWNGFDNSIVLYISISSLDSFISSSFLYWFLILLIIIPSLPFIGLN